MSKARNRVLFLLTYGLTLLVYGKIHCNQRALFQKKIFSRPGRPDKIMWINFINQKQNTASKNVYQIIRFLMENFIEIIHDGNGMFIIIYFIFLF